MKSIVKRQEIKSLFREGDSCFLLHSTEHLDRTHAISSDMQTYQHHEDTGQVSDNFFFLTRNGNSSSHRLYNLDAIMQYDHDN